MKTLNKKNLQTMAAQRGTVLLMTLISLMVLLLGAAAMLRSASTTLVLAGDRSIQRDLASRAEYGLADAMQIIKNSATTPLSTYAYYSPQTLPSDAQGVPLLFLLGVGNVKDIDAGNSVKVSYVIERLCSDSGAFDVAKCSFETIVEKGSGVPNNQPVYRISVRVDDGRKARAYIQATVTQ